MFSSLVKYILLCLAVLIASGCQSREPAPPSYPGLSHAISALPYVESVDFPDVIYEDEPFDITLQLSSALNPEFLRGAGWLNPLWECSLRWQFPPFPSFAWGGNHVIMETWFTFKLFDGTSVFPDAPYSETAVFTLDMPTGDWVLVVSSADTPEWGGLEDMILMSPSFEPPDNPHVVYKQYPFTVVKRPAE